MTGGTYISVIAIGFSIATFVVAWSRRIDREIIELPREALVAAESGTGGAAQSAQRPAINAQGMPLAHSDKGQ